MPPGVRIDKTKHEVDITEQVSRGVRTEEEPTRQTTAADPGVRPWLAGHVLTAVEVQVLNRRDDESGE